MRLRVHSTRLAVSFLLGTMFVLPVAKSVQAAPITTSPIAKVVSDSQPCLAPSSITPTLFTYGMPSQFLPITQISSKSVVITQANDDHAASFSPSKTVLKKVDTDESKEIVIIPAPAILASSSSSFTPTIPESNTGQGLNAETLFAMVNNYRAQVGLPAFVKDTRVCVVAISRAPELENEIYGNSYMHAGFKARNLGFSANENIISMRTESEALTWWLNSPVHRAALLGNSTYACVACKGNSCAMIFSNLEPKQQVSTQSIQPSTPSPSSSAATPAVNVVVPIVK